MTIKAPHNWKTTSPSMYETTSTCLLCGGTHTESADNVETRLPADGCDLSLVIDKDELYSFFINGPVWDGNVLSKAGRDRLVIQGLVKKFGGYQWLTDLGNLVCVAIGFNRPTQRPINFQASVTNWMLHTFPLDVVNNVEERNHRFLEESLELVQALGCTRDEVLQLVDYVYGRPIGEPAQEVGGVTVTLAALCHATHLDMETCGAAELDRVWRNVDKIRAKQASKPKFSPLPGNADG